MAYALSVQHHQTIASLWRMVRLLSEVAREEERVRRALRPDQLAGRACAVCGRQRVPLRPLVELDGSALGVCCTHKMRGVA